MRIRSRLQHLFLIAALFSAAAPTLSFAESGKAIPAPPYYYVLDEPGVLNPTSLKAIESLLIQHDRITGEQFLIAIFNSLDGQDPVDWTARVFTAWKVGKRDKDNGVLLALYWKEHQARIMVGYGLEAVLTDAKSKQVIEDFLVPELKAGHPDRAISLAAVQILKVLGSPLITGGEAEKILRSGGIRGNLNAPMARHAGTPIWFPLLFLGIILFVIALNLITAAEAHFTSGGWSRHHPWRRNRWWGGGGGWGGGGWGGGGWGGGGGGWSGGGGGGGGFSGGGGSTGGGGAGGSW